jgi:hypothetical protein
MYIIWMLFADRVGLYAQKGTHTHTHTHTHDQQYVMHILATMSILSNPALQCL